MLGTIPKTFSADTLDLSSVDSMSLDEHIEIKIPESRARENRIMAQNNFVHHINERSRNPSHTHLAVENGQEIPRNHLPNHHHQEYKHHDSKEHMHRSHSHASMKRMHAVMPNGIGHAANGHHEHRHDEHSKLKK